MAERDELKHYIFVVSGDDVEKDLSPEDFELVVQKALRIYGKYMPAEKEMIVLISGGLSSHPLFSASYQFEKPYPVAATATPIVPTGIQGLATYTYAYDPKTGILRVPTPGSYIVKYVGELTLESVNEADHPLFYEVLEAVYKMAVGGNRKRSTLTELQFTTDGEQMYEEGRAQLELLETQVLPDNMPFWMALT